MVLVETLTERRPSIPTKTKGRRVAVSEAPPPEPPPVDETDQEDQLDRYTALLRQYSDDTIIELSRIEPATWQGQTIKGYVGQLTPGCDLEYIRRTYGGNRYRVNLKDASTGRILGGLFLDISGAPRLQADTVDEFVDQALKEKPSATVNVGGVDVPFSAQNLDEIKSLMLFVKALKAAFPEPPDINVELLTALIGARSQSDPLEQIARLREALPELFQGKDQASETWPGLLSKAVDRVGDLVKLAPRPTIAQGPAAGLSLGRPPGEPAGAGPGDNPETPQPISGESINPMTDMRAIAGVAIVQVCRSFQLRHTVETVVKALDTQLGLVRPEDREPLQQYRDHLLSMSETELADWFREQDDPEEARKRFGEFYGQVFDQFIDPTREVFRL